MTRNLSNDDLAMLKDHPFPTPDLYCHTQCVERSGMLFKYFKLNFIYLFILVRLVSEAVKHFYGQEDSQGSILVGQKSRKKRKNIEKKDSLQAGQLSLTFRILENENLFKNLFKKLKKLMNLNAFYSTGRNKHLLALEHV